MRLQSKRERAWYWPSESLGDRFSARDRHWSSWCISWAQSYFLKTVRPPSVYVVLVGGFRTWKKSSVKWRKPGNSSSVGQLLCRSWSSGLPQSKFSFMHIRSRTFSFPIPEYPRLCDGEDGRIDPFPVPWKGEKTFALRVAAESALKATDQEVFQLWVIRLTHWKHASTCCCSIPWLWSWMKPTELRASSIAVPPRKGLKSMEGTVGCIRASLKLLANRNGIDNDILQWCRGREMGWRGDSPLSRTRQHLKMTCGIQTTGSSGKRETKNSIWHDFSFSIYATLRNRSLEPIEQKSS